MKAVDENALAVATLLFDEDLLKALGARDPKLVFIKRRSLNEEEFKRHLEIMRELSAIWDKGSKSWYLKPQFRLHKVEKVLELIDELYRMGFETEYRDEGATAKVRIDEDLVTDALSYIDMVIEELSEKAHGTRCFKLRKLGAEEFKKLLKFAEYRNGTFCVDTSSPLPRELIELIFENAMDSNALIVAKALERASKLEREVVFKGNKVVIKLDPEDVSKLLSEVEPLEDCEVRNPTLEKLRRERGLSYCEYKWVQVGDELELRGTTRRLYEIDTFEGTLETFRGLFSRVSKILNKDYGVHYEPRVPEETSQEFLRDYQREAVNSALKLLKLQGAATIQAATGAGKTEMAVAIAKELLEKGVVDKVFFLSLNRTLNIQAVERFKKYGLDAGLVDSENFDVEKRIVACTVQTLYKSLEKLGKTKSIKERETVEDVVIDWVDLGKEKAAKLVEEYEKAGLVIVDEVQHVPARTVSEVVSYNATSLRLGLSATPWRDDGRDVLIFALIGDVAERKITSSELIERGYLVPVKIIMWKRQLEVPEEALGELKGLTGARKYAKLKNYVFYNEKRNEEIAEIALAAPKPVLILTKEIKHAKELFEKVKLKGLSSMVLTGKESSSQRSAALRLVKEEKLDVLVATTLADEGLDLPPLKTLILAAGGRSQTRTLQRIGRVTRPYPGKKKGLVVDVWDIDHELGGIFYRQGLARFELYKLEPKWEVVQVKKLKEVKRELAKEGLVQGTLKNFGLK